MADPFLSFERLTGMRNPTPPEPAPQKPIPKELAALRFVAENIDSPDTENSTIARETAQKLNLTDAHLNAYKYANELEDSYFKQKGYVAKKDPTDMRIMQSNKIKNKINDTIAMARPALDIQGVGKVNRFFIKNLIDSEPLLQQEYLRREGFQTRIREGEVEVKKPGELRYQKIDPSDLDIQDVTDVVGDVLEGAYTGAGAAFAGSLGGITAGPVGAVLGAGAAGGALGGQSELLRQAIAKKIGIRNEYNPNLIATSAGTGALIEMALPAIGKIIRRSGAADVAAAGSLKKNAMDISTKIEQAGLEPLFVQVADSQNYVNLFRKVVEGIQTPLNKDYSNQMKKAYDDAKIVIRGLVDGADFADTSIKGTALKDAFANDFAKIFAPSEQLYNESFEVLSKTPYKPLEMAPSKNIDVIGTMRANLIDYLDSLKGEEKARINNLAPVLDEFIASAEGISTIKGLKEFKTKVYETLKRRDFPLAKGAKGYLSSTILPFVHDLRTESIDALIRNYDLDSKSKFFDLLDDRLSKVKGYEQFSDLKDEVLDALDDVKEMASKKGSTLYGVLKSDKAQLLSDNIDEFIDALGASPIAKTKEFQSLRNDYLDYIDTYSHVKTAKQKLSQADEIYKIARQGINALFSKTGVSDVFGEPKPIFQKYMAKLAQDDVVKNLIDTKNVEKVEAIKRFYPDAFNKFKKAKLGDIFREVIDINNDVNITEFKKAIKKLSDGEKIALFGDEWAAKVDGLEAYLSTLPQKLNTSGTAIWYELMNWDKWYSPISEPFKLAKSGFEALRLKRLQKYIETEQSTRERMVNAISKRFKNTPLGYATKQEIKRGIVPLISSEDENERLPE